jgi:hypothetical protein
MLKFLENLFKETCAIMASMRGFGSKTETFGDFSRAKGPKNPFGIALTKAAA